MKQSIKYSVGMRPNPMNAEEEPKAYGTIQLNATLSLEDMAEHIHDHNTVFSKGVILGVLTDMTICLKEALSEGNAVSFGDLGTFRQPLMPTATPSPLRRPSRLPTSRSTTSTSRRAAASTSTSTTSASSTSSPARRRLPPRRRRRRARPLPTGPTPKRSRIRKDPPPSRPSPRPLPSGRGEDPPPALPCREGARPSPRSPVRGRASLRSSGWRSEGAGAMREAKRKVCPDGWLRGKD